jgi:hypothetical protein
MELHARQGLAGRRAWNPIDGIRFQSRQNAMGTGQAVPFLLAESIHRLMVSAQVVRLHSRPTLIARTRLGTLQSALSFTGL